MKPKCPDCPHNAIGRLPVIIRAYLDSQKASEKANHVHSDDSGIFWEGREGDCPICNPKCEHKNLGPLALGGTQRCLNCHEWLIAKSLTQCPECKGAMKVIDSG